MMLLMVADILSMFKRSEVVQLLQEEHGMSFGEVLCRIACSMFLAAFLILFFYGSLEVAAWHLILGAAFGVIVAIYSLLRWKK